MKIHKKIFSVLLHIDICEKSLITLQREQYQYYNQYKILLQKSQVPGGYELYIYNSDQNSELITNLYIEIYYDIDKSD